MPKVVLPYEINEQLKTALEVNVAAHRAIVDMASDEEPVRARKLYRIANDLYESHVSLSNTRASLIYDAGKRAVARAVKQNAQTAATVGRS